MVVTNGDFMLLFGLIWAAFAPMLVSIIALGVAWLTLRLFQKNSKKPIVYVAILTLVWSYVGLQYSIQFQEFQHKVESIQRIYPSDHWQVTHQQETKNGLLTVLLDSPTANSFGYRYVREGFVVQMKKYPSVDEWIQVSSTQNIFNSTISEEPIKNPTARWTIQETFESGSHWSVQWIKIKEDNKIIAQDAIVYFRPQGVVRWSLGSWRTQSEPDIVDGSTRWRKAYYLACWVLKSKTLEQCVN